MFVCVYVYYLFSFSCMHVCTAVIISKRLSCSIIFCIILLYALRCNRTMDMVNLTVDSSCNCLTVANYRAPLL